MKKILFSLMGLMLCGFMAQGQITGNFTGQITDASLQPIPGIAVFYYGTVADFAANGYSPEAYQYADFTDGTGVYDLSFGLPSPDSIVIGILDCNFNLTWKSLSTGTGGTRNENFQMNGCIPTGCDAIFNVDSMWTTTGTFFQYIVTSLRDSNYANISTPITHTWTYNGISRTSNNNWGPNEDTIWIFSPTRPMNVCYQRTAQCAPVCDNVSPTPTGHSCNADFFVDSVNSINFNGQVVVWENSTTDSGATIIGYRWDFGDGSPTVTQQYPSHTYADTGVYEVCLTIVSVMQTPARIDTCVSTHCDSIGFDSNGNLIYKSSGQGFTINVVDPATVSQKEIGLESKFNLYPNPTRGEATLTWDASIGVEQIDVISINGQLVRSIEPNTASVKLNGLQTGVYILRVKSVQGEAAVRMMVQ